LKIWNNNNNEEDDVIITGTIIPVLNINDTVLDNTVPTAIPTGNEEHELQR
jgi:hypothetical protein